jgi:hypothetical protein
LQEKVRNWLSPPDPSTNQNTIYEAFQIGTGSWFFKGNVFAEWKATGPILWIHGKRMCSSAALIRLLPCLGILAGSGKSTLMYVLLDIIV